MSILPPVNPIGIVIPTYRREQVLLDTIHYLLALGPAPVEILVIDQTEHHETATATRLESLAASGAIRWIRLSRPSITHAMNVGLLESRSEIVLFLDDDIVPGSDLVRAHVEAHAERSVNIVAGQVLQPWEEALPPDVDPKPFRFCSSRRSLVTELMGGNLSVKKDVAIRLGGFDENFVHVAYRFEAEFCDRALVAGESILFEPRASICHLKAIHGGTRSFGNYLTTVRPSHAVGAYYYLFRARNVRNRWLQLLARPLRAVRTRHHLTRPWWIPGTLIAELAGLLWAVGLALRGPRLLREEPRDGTGS